MMKRKVKNVEQRLAELEQKTETKIIERINTLEESVDKLADQLDALRGEVRNLIPLEKKPEKKKIGRRKTARTSYSSSD